MPSRASRRRWRTRIPRSGSGDSTGRRSALGTPIVFARKTIRSRRSKRWLAVLQDGHTWAWEPLGNLPYGVRVADGRASFVRVPDDTSGYREGVRPGWELVAIDGSPVDTAAWLARAAAPPHSRALIAGRRLLADAAGAPRTLTTRSLAAASVTWEEAPMPLPEGPLVTWRALDDRTGYVRVRAIGRGVDEALDGAIAELAARERLILDLRGNPRGNLVLACRARDRFLRDRTTLGSVRYSVGEGRLSNPFAIVGEPAAPEKRWPGSLVVLADPLTFGARTSCSACRAIEHVTVVGEPSGGGSGRPRALRLLSGWTLTVSTALTYDRNGRCVEGAGVPVDLGTTGTDEDVLAAARAL